MLRVKKCKYIYKSLTHLLLSSKSTFCTLQYEYIMKIKKAKLNNDLQKAESIFNEMKLNGIIPNDHALNTMISVYGESKQSLKAMKLFNKISKINIVSINNILNVCYLCNQPKIAWKIFKDLMLSSSSQINDNVTKKLLFKLFSRNKTLKQEEYKWLSVNLYFTQHPNNTFISIASFILNENIIYITNGCNNDYKEEDDDIHFVDTFINTKMDKLSVNLLTKLIKSIKYNEYFFDDIEYSSLMKAIAILLNYYPKKIKYDVLLNSDLCEKSVLFIKYLSCHNLYKHIEFRISCNYGINQYIFINGNGNYNLSKNNNKSKYEMTKELKKLIINKEYNYINKLWLKLLSLFGINLDIITYSIILKIFSDCNHPFLSYNQRIYGMHSIIFQMKQNKILIDYGICGTMLKIYNNCLINNYKQKKCLFNKSHIDWIWNHLIDKQEIIHCNISIYNMFINLYGFLNEINKMNEIFEYILENNNNLIPNHYTMNTLLKYEKDIKNINYILNIMDIKYKIKANNVTNNILSTLYHNGIYDKKINFKYNSRTYSTLLKNATIHSNNDLAYSIIKKLINDKKDNQSLLLYPLTLSIDFVTKRNDIYTFYQLINNLDYSQLDIRCIISLFKSFGHFRDSLNIKKLINYVRNRDDYNHQIEKIYLKACYQINIFNDNNNINLVNINGIGNIKIIQKTIKCFKIIEDKYITNNDKNTINTLALQKFHQSLKYLSYSLNKDNININNNNNDEIKYQWTPFSYLFESIFKSNSYNNDIFSLFNILNKIKMTLKENNLDETYLLPSTICVLLTNNNCMYYGFSNTTIPFLRVSTYKNIYNKLPIIMKKEVDNYLNNNNDNDINYNKSKLQLILNKNVNKIECFGLNWKMEYDKNNNWIVQRGMCLTCKTIFKGLQEKSNYNYSNSSNYILQCAEWEAITKLCLSLVVQS